MNAENCWSRTQKLLLKEARSSFSSHSRPSSSFPELASLAAYYINLVFAATRIDYHSGSKTGLAHILVCSLSLLLSFLDQWFTFCLARGPQVSVNSDASKRLIKQQNWLLLRLFNVVLFSVLLLTHLSLGSHAEVEKDDYFTILIALNYNLASYFWIKDIYRASILHVVTGVTYFIGVLVCLSEDFMRPNLLKVLIKFFSAVLLLTVCLYPSTRTRRESSKINRKILERLVKDSTSGNLLIKDKTVLLYNKKCQEILKKREHEPILFADLLGLKFNRYFKIEEKSPLLFWKSFEKKESILKNSKLGVTRPFGIEDLIEILERSPEKALSFYLKIEEISKTSSLNKENFVLAKPHAVDAENLLPGNSEERRLPDPENDINLQEEEPVVVRQFEVKIMFVEGQRASEKLVFFMFTDVTEAQHIKEMEKQSELNLHMLNSFSHELNTPLNIAKNFLKAAIKDPFVPDSVKEKFLAVAKVTLKLLSYMITDIIDFLKIETGQLCLDFETFCLAKILRKVEKTVDFRLREKKIALILDIDSLNGVSTYFDKKRLKRIIINLLLMHAKYCTSPSILLSGKKIEEEKCCISVEELSEAQSPLVSSSPNFSSSNVQSEFSLTVVKLLTREMSAFGLESFSTEEKNPRRRSCFVFRLKKEESSVNSSEKKQSVTPEGKAEFRVPRYFNFKENNIANRDFLLENQIDRCPKILIVDDDPFNLLSLEMILEKLKLNALKASNGAEAILVLREHFQNHACSKCSGVKCIFMDLMMPVMDGLESSTRLTGLMRQGSLPTIPIIACTANDSKAYIEECERIGMKGFVTKPINLKKIREVLEVVGAL